MNTSFLLIGGIIIAGFAVIYFRLSASAPKRDDENGALKMLNENFNERMREMSRQFQEQTKQVNLQLSKSAEILQKSNKSIGERLDGAAKAVGGVTERLGKMEEANKRIYDIGKDIASLQDILRAPKLRGSMGEFFLGDLLGQYFSKDQFTMPYKFRNGAMVDAALHVADKRIVPIDSKFPLENFKKFIDAKDEKEKKVFQKAFVSDVKKRIDEIARYILPDEGTLDFALLYIPAENVYYEVIVKDEAEDSLSAYAFKKRVIPVSPNNFFVYIQTVLMGLRGLQIGESAKEMQQALKGLKGDFEKFGDEFSVLGSHITNAGNKYDESKRRYEKIGQKLETIEQIGSDKKETKMLVE